MKEKIFNKKTLYYITTLFIALAVGLAGGIVDILHTDGVLAVVGVSTTSSPSSFLVTSFLVVAVSLL